jgi:hypothetical protein
MIRLQTESHICPPNFVIQDFQEVKNMRIKPLLYSEWYSRDFLVKQCSRAIIIFLEHVTPANYETLYDNSVKNLINFEQFFKIDYR